MRNGRVREPRDTGRRHTILQDLVDPTSHCSRSGQMCAICRAYDRADKPGQLAIAGRNLGPSILFDWYLDGELRPEELAELILRVWSSAEFPALTLGTEMWTILFEAAGFVTDGPSLPDGPIRMYRGASPKTARGMSWTVDPDRAAWFANRLRNLGYDGRVWTALAPAAAILGFVGFRDHDRGEEEVILNVDAYWEDLDVHEVDDRSDAPSAAGGPSDATFLGASS